MIQDVSTCGDFLLTSSGDSVTELASHWAVGDNRQ
jgi:hypothetical protein